MSVSQINSKQKNTSALSKLTELEAKKIKVALTVIEGSRKWFKMTTNLVVFNAYLLSTEPEDGIDYPLCFHGDNAPIKVSADVNNVQVEGGSLEVNVPTGGGELSNFEKHRFF